MATALIWGSPGSGKTVASTAPKDEKILLLCSDNSSVVLNMFDRKNVTVERVEHWLDPGDGENYFLRQFEKARLSGKYTLIVIDNLSDLFDMAILDIEENGKIKDVRQIYLVVYQAIKRLTRLAANSNCHVTFTAWDTSEEVPKMDGTMGIRLSPNLPNKIRSQVLGLCNVVGQMAKVTKDGKTIWFLVTEDSETRYGCKDQLYGRKSLMPENIFIKPEAKK